MFALHSPILVQALIYWHLADDVFCSMPLSSYIIAIPPTICTNISVRFEHREAQYLIILIYDNVLWVHNNATVMEPICQNVFEKFSFPIKIPKNQVTQVENWVLMPHVPKLYIFFKWVILLNRWYNVTWFIWKSSMRTKETNSYKQKKKNFYCSKIYLTIKTITDIVWEKPDFIREIL